MSFSRPILPTLMQIQSGRTVPLSIFVIERLQYIQTKMAGLDAKLKLLYFETVPVINGIVG